MFKHFLLVAQTTSSGDTTEADKTKDVAGEFDTDFSSILETIDNIWDGFVSLLPQIILGTIVFVCFYFVARLLRNIIRRATKDRASKNLGLVLGRLAQWALIFVGILVATAIIAPSVKPGDLIAGLGIGGIAIGFAFKDILQNFLAGILILLREPFKIGDQIRSGEFEGTVEAIETRATMIKTYDGRRVVVPNSQIYTNPVVVNTAYESRRSQYDVGIGCGDDLREAAKIMHRVMKDVEGVVAEPAPDVLVVDLAESSVNLRCRWWTAPDQATVMRTQHEVIAQVKVALDDAAIDMPYPTRVLLFHDQTDEYDGDRTRQREGWPAGSNNPAPLRKANKNN